MHRRTQYGHPHTPTTSRPSPSSQARRGAPAPATPARRGPSQPSPQNREAPPRQLLAHLKPPPFVPAPTPGFGGVLRAWALVCPAGNDPRCCPAPLFSLEGTYFGHPRPPPRAPSRSRDKVRAPRWNFLAGSSRLCPDTLLPPPGPGPHRQPGRPLPGPRRPCRPRAAPAALPRSSRRCVHM